MTPQKEAPPNQPLKEKNQQGNQVVQGRGVCFITLGKGNNRANYEMSKQVRIKVDYKQIFPLQSAAGCNDRQKHYW